MPYSFTYLQGDNARDSTDSRIYDFTTTLLLYPNTPLPYYTTALLHNNILAYSFTYLQGDNAGDSTDSRIYGPVPVALLQVQEYGMVE